MKYANLHLHSTYSDAEFTPKQLVLLGKSLGYKAIALTDHETDAGCHELKRYADREGGIEVLPGIEFYGKNDGKVPHIVCLDHDPENPKLRAFVRERVEAYNEYTRKCVEYGIKIGVIEGITWDDVVKYSGKGAWICIDTVFNTYRTLHIPIPENLRQAVFKDPEMRQYRPQKATAEEVIKVIRKAGGIAILAHPNNFTQYVPQLVEYGLNGIEIDHPEISEETKKLAEEAAKAYNLYRSGGTDHTGPMSCCGGKGAVPVFNGITEEEYVTIKERRLG